MIYNKQNDELETYLKNLYKSDYHNFINLSPPKAAIRINTLKCDQKKFKNKLKKWKLSPAPINYHSTGLIIEDDSIPLSHTLEYFCGHFFYQGASSQLPVELLDIKPGEKVLDMAAAPGSKSCQILNKLNHQGMLVSNDCSTKRLQPLNVNLQRSGAVNYVILNMWGEQLGSYFNEYFDKVLLDAPCTALGTIAVSNEVVNWWSQSKLNKLTKSQYALLVSALKSLKVNGELVYSTCSVTPEENEAIIQKIIQSYPVEIVEPLTTLQNRFDPGITKFGVLKFNKDLEKAIRIVPHKHGSEGFFAVKLKKIDSIKNNKIKKFTETKKLKDSKDLVTSDILSEISDKWGIRKEFWNKYKFNLTKNRIWISKNIRNVLADNFVCCGILLAERKLSGWKLFNNSVTFLNSNIKNRLITLKDNQLKLLFRNAEIENENCDDGYFVLQRKNKPIGSVYVENGKMRIRLPHSFNLTLD